MMKYHVENPKESVDELVCAEDDFGNYAIMVQSIVPPLEDTPDRGNGYIWKMHFDRA
jgi:hypothetical protein